MTRNEAAHLPRLAAALVNQRRCPTVWLIVDDESTDETASLIDDLTRGWDWITARPAGRPSLRERGFDGVGRSARPGRRDLTRIGQRVSLGMGELLRHPVDVLVTVDADVSFDSDYFERLIALFSSDAALGIASGARQEWVAGAWRARRLTSVNVEAQCRAYRRAVIASLLPLESHAGWDGVDVVRAHLLGWRTSVDRDLQFRHHRLIGARDGTRFNAWTNEGRAAWAMHYRPSYLALRAAYQSQEEVGAIGLLIGYGRALWGREPRCLDEEVSRFIRAEQRLSRIARRRSEVTERAGASSEREPVDVVLVAEPGGHLAELWAMRDAWMGLRTAWLTLPAAQAESLLHGEHVYHLRGPTRRNSRSLLLNLALSWKLLRRLHGRVLLASGSGLTVPVAWVARLVGMNVLFVECGGRADTPSLSFRLVAPVADRLYVQWKRLAGAHARARYVGTVPWEQPSMANGRHTPGEGTFVTVGTDERYPFDRLLRAVEDAGVPRPLVVQRGVSRVEVAEARTVSFVSEAEVDDFVAQAEVVISHAGIGSAMLARRHNRRLIVMPRSARLGEAVDDHQHAFAKELAAIGVPVVHDSRGLRRALEVGGSEVNAPSSGSALVAEVRRYLKGEADSGHLARSASRPSRMFGLSATKRKLLTYLAGISRPGVWSSIQRSWSCSRSNSDTRRSRSAVSMKPSYPRSER